MHITQERILAYAKTCKKPISTQDLATHLYPQLVQETNEHYVEITSKDDKNTVHQLHRRILHHTNALQKKGLLQLSAIRGKGLKYYCLPIKTKQQQSVYKIQHLLEENSMIIDSEFGSIAPLMQIEMLHLVSWQQFKGFLTLLKDKCSCILLAHFEDYLLENPQITTKDITEALGNIEIECCMISKKPTQGWHNKIKHIPITVYIDATHVTAQEIQQLPTLFTKYFICNTATQGVMRVKDTYALGVSYTIKRQRILRTLIKSHVIIDLAYIKKNTQAAKIQTAVQECLQDLIKAALQYHITGKHESKSGTYSVGPQSGLCMCITNIEHMIQIRGVKETAQLIKENLQYIKEFIKEQSLILRACGMAHALRIGATFTIQKITPDVKEFITLLKDIPQVFFYIQSPTPNAIHELVITNVQFTMNMKQESASLLEYLS
ncbi:MAG: hypothetical protein ACI8Y7_000235 [Candidatus Woesearchaeota archaeon]|jgi:hypothetical protein